MKGIAMNDLPIGDYGLLSDCRSAALVSRAGSVDWLCFPRFDGPAVFARILDPGGGYFAIRPVGDFAASRAYVDQTMALGTTFRAATGTAVLPDAMAVGRNDRGHDLGARSPGALLRRLTCTDGELEVEVSYAPAPGVRPDPPGSRSDPGRRDRPRRRRPAAAIRAGPLATGRGHRYHPSSSQGGPDHELCAAARADGGAAAGRLGRRRDRRPAGGHPGRMAVLVGHTPNLRGPVARPCPPLRTGTASAHVRPDRRDRRRTHHLAAGNHRRRAQLGLPLHLGARLLPDHGGAVGGGLPRRGQQVLRLSWLTRRPRSCGAGWTCRSCSGSAGRQTL